MSERPFFKHSIADLEKLVRSGQPDLATLTKLEAELANHRNTDRAARLLMDVRTARSSGNETASRPTSPPPARPSPPGPQPAASASVGRTAFEPARSDLPPLLDLGVASKPLSPGAQDEPRGILAAWTALECLSPQTFAKPEDLVGGDRRCVAKLTDGLPWTRGESSRPNYRLYYQVVLGSVAMDRATDRLLSTFGDDEERGRVKGHAAIAAILLDRSGRLLEDKAVAVSSFAWALPLALKLDLGGMAGWPAVEPRVVEALDRMLRHQDTEGRELPVDMPTIDRAFRWLLAQFGMPDDLVERPAYALRTYHWFKAKNPPEVQLLNSFFLGDLSKASKTAADGALPVGLRAYLGLSRPAAPIDLLADPSAVERAAAPGMAPHGRWPTRGGHPLVLLQQAAVNLARKELGGREGVVAVNAERVNDFDTAGVGI